MCSHSHEAKQEAVARRQAVCCVSVPADHLPRSLLEGGHIAGEVHCQVAPLNLLTIAPQVYGLQERLCSYGGFRRVIPVLATPSVDLNEVKKISKRASLYFSPFLSVRAVSEQLSRMSMLQKMKLLEMCPG